MATADLRPGAKGIVLLLLLNLLPFLEARLQLANTLGSHMVLQRAPHRAVLYGVADGWAKIDVRVQAEKEGKEGSGIYGPPSSSLGGRAEGGQHPSSFRRLCWLFPSQ